MYTCTVHFTVLYNMKQVQRALRERNECTRALPIIMPVSRELNSRAHDLHIANNAQCHWHKYSIHKWTLDVRKCIRSCTHVQYSKVTVAYVII